MRDNDLTSRMWSAFDKTDSITKSFRRRKIRLLAIRIRFLPAARKIKVLETSIQVGWNLHSRSPNWVVSLQTSAQILVARTELSTRSQRWLFFVVVINLGLGKLNINWAIWEQKSSPPYLIFHEIQRKRKQWER